MVHPYARAMRMKATVPTIGFCLRLGLTSLAGMFFAGLDVCPVLAASPSDPADPPPAIMPAPAPRGDPDHSPRTAPEGVKPHVTVPDRPLSRDQMDGPAAKSPDVAKPPSGPQTHQADAPPDLNTLFDRLRLAKSEDEAALVNLMIETDFLQSGSDTIDLLMFRALSALQNQDLPLSMDLLDTVIALKPDYAEGWNKRATLYFMKRDYGKAISDVEMVLRLQPRHYPALIGLASMMVELGDRKSALDALKRVHLIYPMNSTVTKEIEELEAELGGQAL